MILTGVIFAATILTATMFITRQAMLGFACAIFWALTGGYAYTLSSVAWDFYFIFAFACLLGMTTFCALGAYGLRERRDTIADVEMERGDGRYIDERPGRPKRKKSGSDDWYDDDGVPDLDEESLQPKTTSTVRRPVRPKRKGEFDF